MSANDLVVAYSIREGEDRITACDCPGWGLTVDQTFFGDLLEVTEFHAADCRSEHLSAVLLLGNAWQQQQRAWDAERAEEEEQREREYERRRTEEERRRSETMAAVGCPRCGAEPSMPCVTPSGLRVPSLHADRRVPVVATR